MPALPEIRWQFGPADIQLGGQATLRLPQGYLWSDPGETRRFLEASGNPPSGQEVAIIGPLDLAWFAVFSFDGYETMGFLKGSTPDVEAITQALRRGNEEANNERARQGQTTLDLVDWAQRPRYDPVSKNLEWSLHTVESGGREVANYFTFYLGRDGVMSVEMVTNPKDLPRHQAALKSLLRGFRFLPGKSHMVRDVPGWWWAIPVVPALAAMTLVIFRRRRSAEPRPN
jgi:uncharacterized membrane-anchored protein